jgi:hypothetical protein
LVTQLLALIEGRVQAQAQSITDTPDREVTRSHTGEAPLSADSLTTVTDTRVSTELHAQNGSFLRLPRLLRPTPAPDPRDAIGHVAGAWQLPDGTRARALFAVLHAGAGV